MSSEMKADESAARYIKLREFKEKITAELKEKTAKIEVEMDRLEAEMMMFLNETRQDSAKTASGTFFKKTSMSAKVADRDTFLPWVFASPEDRMQFLENRVNKTAVDEYLEEHKELPPGVDVVRVVSISVNRPRTR